MDLIYSFNEISHILIDFECITKFRIGLFDNHFHEILSYPSVYQIFVKLFDLMNHSICNAKECDYHSFNIANLMVIPMSINVTLGLQKS